MKVRDTNHVANFHDLCPRQVRDFVVNLSRTLSPTFLMHCNELNSITATQTGLLRTCHGLCRKHLDMSRWFVSATFVICVHNFPLGKVSVKVGVMEFGLITVQCITGQYSKAALVEIRSDSGLRSPVVIIEKICQNQRCNLSLFLSLTLYLILKLLRLVYL